MLACPGCGIPLPRRESGKGLQKKYCSAKCRSDVWRAANPERDLASKRKYWTENRPMLREKGRAYYHRTKKIQLAKAKIYYQETRVSLPWRIIFNSAKARAVSKHLAFDLTHDWIKNRWTGKCELTGIPFVQTPRGKPKTFAASIDRIEASKGYVQSNCRIILHGINVFKGGDTDENMLLVARALLNAKK